MHADSISLSQRKPFGRNRSPIDDSLSFSTSETSAQSARRFQERLAIFNTRYEFALLIIGLQTGVTQLMFLFIQVEKYGCVMVFIVSFLITIFMTLPLMVNQIFYGFYNKFGYIKFWNMAPVAFGIGLSMALYSVLECVRWAAIAGLLILHVCYIPFRSMSEWTTCQKIKRPDRMVCYDAASKFPKTSCVLTTYPALEFYRRVSYIPQLEGTGINGAWFVCCFVVWFIVFVMVSQGFRRLKHILIKIPMLCLISLTLLAGFSFLSQKELSVERRSQIFHVEVTPTSFTVVWLVWNAIRVVQIPLGTLCQLGSYAPAGTLALADSVMILLFVFFYNFAFAYFAHCCHAWVELEFAEVDHRCLAQDSLSALFASVPTAISFLAMGNLWLFVFFAGFIMKTIAQIVITLTATMNAMSEMFHLHRRRQQIVAVLCTLALLLNLPITMTDSEMFLKRTSRYVELLVDLSIVNCTGMVLICFYTPSRVFDDIHFAYNREPVFFQKLIFYLSPILMAFVVITGIMYIVAMWPTDPLFYINPWAAPFIGVMVFLLLAPIPAFALYMYVVSLMKHNISAMLQPTPSWGPPEPDVKRARINFNPRSELRYRSKKPCAHNCLLNNLRIKIEVEKRDSQRREFFLNIFHSPSYAEWDDGEDWHYAGDMIGKARTINWAGGFERVASPEKETRRAEDEVQRNEDEENSEDTIDAVDVEKSDEKMNLEEVETSAKEDVDFEEELQEDVKVESDTAALDEKLISKTDIEIGTEIDSEHDVIFPNLNSFELHPRIRYLDTHDDARRTPPSPRYTAVKHRTYLRQRRSGRERATETPIEPPLTRKMYPRLSRKPIRQSTSKSCQTDKGLRRLKNIIHSVLPWKKSNRKKHRCVGTSPDDWPTVGCSRRPTYYASSSMGSETLSETDEWP